MNLLLAVLLGAYLILSSPRTRADYRRLPSASDAAAVDRHRAAMTALEDR